MIESEMHAASISERKQKIRERYRGVDPDLLTVIPADVQAGIYEENITKRVAVYARVSTDDPNQTSSYELQKNHYEDLVNRHPGWELVDIYADEGISGTSLLHRDAFVRMIHDCREKKIDLVITKTVSRFARNVEDCIHYSRALKSQEPPIGILFETEGIYTLDQNSEMQLSFIATLAQEESHTKSEIMNASIEMRFKRGIFLTPVLLGYDHDQDGNLVINEDEAKTVKLIFYMFLLGRSVSDITKELTRLKRITKIGNQVWNESSVSEILHNERYCGDVLAHKTYTPDYLNHKAKKNVRNRPQYYMQDHHEGIISREIYVATQRYLESMKYGFKNALPELRAVDSGVLKGFVQINNRWKGFTGEDYFWACHTVLDDSDYLNPVVTIKRHQGEFDFGKYDVARGIYTQGVKKVEMRVTPKGIRFSVNAIAEMGNTRYIEILIHPLYQIMVVRPTTSTNPHALEWVVFAENKNRPRRVLNATTVRTIYEINEWNLTYSYTLLGLIKKQRDEKVILFFLDEPEIKIPRHLYQEITHTTLPDLKSQAPILAYPKQWGEKVGDAFYYNEAKKISVFNENKIWDTTNPGILAHVVQKLPIEKSVLEEQVKELVEEIEGGK